MVMPRVSEVPVSVPPWLWDSRLCKRDFAVRTVECICYRRASWKGCDRSMPASDVARHVYCSASFFSGYSGEHMITEIQNFDPPSASRPSQARGHRVLLHSVNPAQ